jgi:hypothetical protein
MLQCNTVLQRLPPLCVFNTLCMRFELFYIRFGVFICVLICFICVLVCSLCALMCFIFVSICIGFFVLCFSALLYIPDPYRQSPYGPGPGPGPSQLQVGPGPGPLPTVRYFFQKTCPGKSKMFYIIYGCLIISFYASWQHFATSNMASPAQMTTTARTAPKFCARTRSECLDICCLYLISCEISGGIEPWSECRCLS